MMYKMIHRLRGRFSEVFRIRYGYGLSPIRNKREARALIEFCKSELKEEHAKLNPDRSVVLQATIDLSISDIEELPVEFEAYGKSHSYISLVEIVRDYCGVYWS